MGTQLEIALLVLVAAVLHAGWNALVKMGQDRVMTMALVTAVGSVASALALPFVAAPAPASWRFLLMSGVLHVGYFTFLLEAYRVGDLSHIYPVARGTAPLLVATGAAIFAGESLGLRQVAGLALVSVAITSFALEGGWAGGPSRSFLFGLGTAVFIGAYTVVDGLGVRASGHPLGYILWLFVIDCVPLGLYTVATRRGRLWPYFRAHWRACLIGGVMCGTAYGLVVFSLGLGAMAYVSALRETGVIFAAVIGSALLRESFGRRRVLAASLVAAGILIMNLPG
jgi:drug/metabolite transporter (DMT)-like permease